MQISSKTGLGKEIYWPFRVILVRLLMLYGKVMLFKSANGKCQVKLEYLPLTGGIILYIIDTEMRTVRTLLSYLIEVER